LPCAGLSGRRERGAGRRLRPKVKKRQTDYEQKTRAIGSQSQESSPLPDLLASRKLRPAILILKAPNVGPSISRSSSLRLIVLVHCPSFGAGTQQNGLEAYPVAAEVNARSGGTIIVMVINKTPKRPPVGASDWLAPPAASA
jgi:hypothetical protein